MEFDDAAWWPGGGHTGGAAAGGAVVEQLALGVGESPAPFGAALARDDLADVGGGDGAEPGDLAGVLVVAEQGGQRDPGL